MAMRVAKECERAREKDDARGARIIDDYPEVHPAADCDPIVRQAWEDADRLHDEVEGYLRRFAEGAPVGFPLTDVSVTFIRG